MSNDLWAALVDEPMAQLHGCATRFLTLRGSAYRPGTRAQGPAIANGPDPTDGGDRQSGVSPSAQSAWVMRAPKCRSKETRGNRGEWLRSLRPKQDRTAGRGPRGVQILSPRRWNTCWAAGRSPTIGHATSASASTAIAERRPHERSPDAAKRHVQRPLRPRARAVRRQA